jgi:thioredoxin reductase
VNEKIKSIAKKLDGIEYPRGVFSISSEIRSDAHDENIIIAYGVSDDLLRLEGKVNEEFKKDIPNTIFDEDPILVTNHLTTIKIRIGKKKKLNIVNFEDEEGNV